MKLINLSKTFQEKKPTMFFATIALAMLAIMWVIPTLNTYYRNLSETKTGSLGLQIQTMIILSVVIYPATAFVACFLVSLFRPLKPQDEGGLISDCGDAMRMGCICFVSILIFICLPVVIVGRFEFTADFIAHLIGVINLLLFACTATGLALLCYTLTREFNPKKMPVERIGDFPTK